MPESIPGVVVAPHQQTNKVAEMAAMAFLSGYTGKTFEGYRTDLRIYVEWCNEQNIPVLAMTRPHIELFARSQEMAGKSKSTVSRRLTAIAGFYRYCEIDGYLDRDPAKYVRRPRVSTESTTLGLDRSELSAFIYTSAAMSPTDHALACLLGLNGLRVSEACGIDIEDIAVERGHTVVRIVGKGDKPALVPLAPRTARAIQMASGDRLDGPLLRSRTGERMDRHGAARAVRRIAKRANITKHIHPHCLRHSFITAALDAHVPLRDVQIAARHADPRTTTRYDRARQNLDRHATYVVAAYIAGS